MAKSIVVIDDEKLVIYGLCSILSDIDSEYTVTATGSCGEEGLRLCMENSPDLLLTDIGMPGMDGLELIEKVKQTNPEIKVVVLSCHDEYNLVHKAFMLGADDYILKKDIDRLNLCNLLNRVLPDKPVNKPASAGGAAIKPLTDTAVLIPENPGCVAIIGFKDGNLKNGRLWQPDIPMLRQLINSDIEPFGEYYLGAWNDLMIYFPGFGKDKKHKLDFMLGKAMRSASKYINSTIFISEYFTEQGESLIDGYNSGLNILTGMFYLTEGTILTAPPAPPDKSINLTFELAAESLEKEWHSTVKGYLLNASEKRIDPDTVKSELNFAIGHLLHHLKEYTESDFSPAFTETSSVYRQKILNFNDVEMLNNWCIDFLSQTARELRERQNSGRAVYNAKVYINSNLESDLSLSRVAGMLAINSNHLSTIFKKTTGKSYIEYVNMKRINRACELLETTDLSAKEIAYQCGYDNPNYFSRIFKKIMNITVTEYRSAGNGNL